MKTHAKSATVDPSSVDYKYSAEPTKNPLRYALAIWRLLSKDTELTTDEAAIVEMGFARSRTGRRFARWEEMVAHLKNDPRTASAFTTRRQFGPIVLSDLEKLPEGTLGHVFAVRCRVRGIDPNLVHVPPTGEIGWMLNHMFQTHDIWHVLTGWGNDLTGEFGLGAFYAAQFAAPPFFGYMLSLGLLNVVARKGNGQEMLQALTTGWQGGRQAEPLFGTNWEDLWEVPIDTLRTRFALDQTKVVGEGVRAAA